MTTKRTINGCRRCGRKPKLKKTDLLFYFECPDECKKSMCFKSKANALFDWNNINRQFKYKIEL